VGTRSSPSVTPTLIGFQKLFPNPSWKDIVVGSRGITKGIHGSNRSLDPEGRRYKAVSKGVHCGECSKQTHRSSTLCHNDYQLDSSKKVAIEATQSKLDIELRDEPS
jgi:hypothetical protein